MPDRRNVRWSQLKVGLLALAAMAILAVLIFLLTSTGGAFQQYATLRTYFDDASGTAAKAPVRLNGILIGFVDDIKLSGSKEASRAVEFDLSIRREFIKNIPQDSVATINAASLLGDKYINITRGNSPQPVKAGGELRGMAPQDLPEIMAQSANVMQTLQNIVRRVDDMIVSIDKGQGNLGKLLRDEELYRRLNAVAAESQQLVGDIRTGKGTLSRLLYEDTLYQEVRAPIQRLDLLLADLQRGQGTAGKLLRDPAMFNEAERTMAELNQLVRELNAGKGTAGKLLNNDQLWERINVLVTRLNGTLDKINSGQGTLGQLVVNQQLYEQLTAAANETKQLIQAMRANPKKFLSFKLSLF